MKRRALLRRGGVVALAAATAGCTTSGDTAFSLSIADTAITETEDGYVAAEVTVTNTGTTEQSGVLYVTAELNGEKSVEIREVTMSGNSTRVVTVTYDVKMKDVSSFTPQANVRPPENGTDDG